VLDNLMISRTGTIIVFSAKYTFAMVTVPSDIISLCTVHEKRIKLKPFMFAQIFQY